MDYTWVAVAFICGFLVKQINLPPLVGYLGAGFGLHALGLRPDASLNALADLGVTLLLFTIGLKLNVSNLFKMEVLGSASGHMVITVLLTIIASLGIGAIGVEYFSTLDWTAAALIGFAVSFSSTVFAVKVLEDKGEMRTRHGQVAIGILIIQDIAAVIFFSLATDKSPSLWALALLVLPLARPLFAKLLQYCGHGELLPLVGFFLAYTGGELFELTGLEAHLGALVIGILLSGQPKSVELAKSLLGFKDLFLIGFFLSIGFTALPTMEMLAAAFLITISLPIKLVMFFFWLTGLKLRSRSAFLASLSLTNYGEFGLIVCSVSVGQGLLEKEWLVIMALAVALSFVFSSIVNTKAHDIYARWSGFIRRFELPRRLSGDQYAQLEGISVLVVGMGRVGTGAYDELKGKLCKDVCGVDVDKERVEVQTKDGRAVVKADTKDPDFWAQINLDAIDLIMLALPNYHDILDAVKLLKNVGYKGKTAGIARYEDQKIQLLEAGIDEAFNFHAEAGAGFAEQSIHLLKEDRKNRELSSVSQ